MAVAHGVRTRARKRPPGGPTQSISPKRFEVYLVTLDPTRGAEIRKTRPCLIVSPDELNDYLHTVIVAPMTTVSRQYPSRVDVVFGMRTGQVALDQIRTLDKDRLLKRLGTISRAEAERVVSMLVELFI
jgi:mRNA interferase MazF